MERVKKNIQKRAIHCIIVMLAVSSVLMGSIAEKQVVYAGSKGKVALSSSSETLCVGNKVQLELKGMSKKITWSSDEKSVASVSAKGKVTAKKTGKATITAKAGGKIYKCKVQIVNHKYEDNVVEPKKDQDGYTKHVCIRCGKSYKDNYVSYQYNEEAVYNAIMAMQEEYPEGMAWTNDNYYAWSGGIYSGGYGCAGFAFLLSDAAFSGNAKARMVKDLSNIENEIRIGDILRVDNNSHSVIVIGKTDIGVIVAEGNYNRSIHWGREISFASIKENGTYYITRY